VPAGHAGQRVPVVAGGGRSVNVTRSLSRWARGRCRERPDRLDVEEEFGSLWGRAKIHFERAGIAAAGSRLAVTGDDEDNLVISQIAKEGYRVRKAIARVNDPRNQQHFDLLGITQTVCATTSILGLVDK
jgi:hypothetical protein